MWIGLQLEYHSALIRHQKVYTLKKKLIHSALDTEILNSCQHEWQSAAPFAAEIEQV